MAFQIVKMLWLNYGFVYLLPKYEMPAWRWSEKCAHTLAILRASSEIVSLIAGWFQFTFHTFSLHLHIRQAAESDRESWRTAAMCPRGGWGAADPAVLWGEATFLRVLEQDKDINYRCISCRLRQFKVDLASQMSFTLLFHQIGSANVKLPGFLWSALRPHNQTSRINTQTHSHKLRAGSYKLPETQQEVFFCGQKLSQLEHEREKDTLIRRWWQADFSRQWVTFPQGCNPNKRRC